MIEYCGTCKREYPAGQKKCPVCGGRLKERLTEQEQLEKENADFTVISTLLL